MTRPTFPRTPDGHPPAWGLTGATPRTIWERFSPAYEAQAERLCHAIEAQGYHVEFGGAGSEDGEYITFRDAEGEYLALIHLEDPSEARAIAAMDDTMLRDWIAQQTA